MIKEIDKLSSKTNDKSVFPEHEFLLSCYKIGLNIADLKALTYVDVMKMFVSMLKVDNKSSKRATQKDIDRLLG